MDSAYKLARQQGLSLRVFEYSPQTDTWADIGSAPRSYTHAQTFDGRIYTLSSSSAYIDVFDPLTKLWSQANPRPNTATVRDMKALAGKLYLICNDNNVYCYDPADNSWLATDIGLSPSFAAPIYKDLYLLYAAFSDESKNIRKYSPEERMLSTYRSYLHGYNRIYQIHTVNNKAYIFAGYDSQTGATATLEYMPSVSPWAEKACLTFY